MYHFRLSKRYLWRAGEVVVVMLSFLFLGHHINQNWQTVQATAEDISWEYFAGALLILAVAWSVLSIPSFLAVRHHVPGLRYWHTLALFNISQLPKYLPGGIWALPGRMFLYQKHLELQPTLAALFVLSETFSLLFGAIIVGCLAAPLLGSQLLVTGWLILVGISFGVISFFNHIPELIESKMDRFHFLTREIFINTNSSSLITRKAFLHMVLSTITFWIVAGLGFNVLLASITRTTGTMNWPQAIGIYSLAWAVGFLAVFVPAGLGIRETALVFLLNPLMPDGQAVLIAVLARLWWTLAEAVWIMAGFVLVNRVDLKLRN